MAVTLSVGDGDPALDAPFEFANDPRVDVTTTREAVDEGRELAFWEGTPR